MKSRSRAFHVGWLFVATFAASALASALLFADGSVPADEAALIIALPIMIFLILPFVLMRFLPSIPNENQKTLDEMLRGKSVRFVRVVRAIDVIFRGCSYALFVGISVAIAAAAYSLLEMAWAVEAALVVAGALMLLGVVPVLLIVVCLYAVTAVIHIGFGFRRIVISMAKRRLEAPNMYWLAWH